MAIETLKNNNEIEITSINSALIPITVETINSGTINEKKVFNISGRIKPNNPTIIGTIKVSAAENKRFIKAPFLNPTFETKKNTAGYFTLGKNKTIRDTSGNITSYVYDLIYTGKKAIPKSNKLKYSLSLNSQKIRTSSSSVGIRRVVHGGLLVKQHGETRNISVYGDVGATVKIAIIKLEDSYDSSDVLLSTVESDIMDEAYGSDYTDTSGNTITLGSSGKEFKLFQKTIDKTGSCSFSQKFPAAISETRYAILVLPSATTGGFEKSWKKEVLEGWGDWYTKIITQVINPTLTLRATKTSSKYRINGEGTGTHTVDLKYPGVWMRGSDHFKDKSLISFSVKYTLTSADVSTFTTDSGTTYPLIGDGNEGVPVFNSAVQSKSDWTNSVAEYNNGTEIEITNIAVAGAGTTTYTLSFNVYIVKFGSKNVTMALDLDTVVNI